MKDCSSLLVSSASASSSTSASMSPSSSLSSSPQQQMTASNILMINHESSGMFNADYASHQQNMMMNEQYLEGDSSSMSADDVDSIEMSGTNGSSHMAYNATNVSRGMNSNGVGAGSASSNRFFPDSVVDILNKWFMENQNYPYPDENVTNILAKEANISAKQVRKWFANKRVRSNKCFKQSSKLSKKEQQPKATRKQSKSISEDMMSGDYNNQQQDDYDYKISEDNESYDILSGSDANGCQLGNLNPALNPTKSLYQSHVTSPSFQYPKGTNALSSSSPIFPNSQQLFRSTSAHTAQDFLNNFNTMMKSQQDYSTSSNLNKESLHQNYKNASQTCNTQRSINLNFINNLNSSLTALSVNNNINNIMNNTNNTNSNTQPSNSSIAVAAAAAAAICNPVLFMNLLQNQNILAINQAINNLSHKPVTDGAHNNTCSSSSSNCSILNETNNSQSLNESFYTGDHDADLLNTSITKRKAYLSQCYMNDSHLQYANIYKANNLYDESRHSSTSSTSSSSNSSSISNLSNANGEHFHHAGSENQNQINYAPYQVSHHSSWNQTQLQHQQQLPAHPQQHRKINFGDISDLIN